MRYAYDASAYEAEEWSRPDEMALFNALWNHARRELDTRPNSRVLDLCCGSGMALLGVASHPHVLHAVGVDVSHRLLAFAHARFLPYGKICFLQGDAATPLFRGSSFDLILASSAYHHIEDHRKLSFLQRCAELLAFNGRLVLAENVLPPYGHSDYEYDDALRRLYEAVNRATALQFPDIPILIQDMIDENVVLGITRQYEYKVDSRRLLADISGAGLAIEESRRVWPPESDALERSAGNYLYLLKRAETQPVGIVP